MISLTILLTFLFMGTLEVIVRQELFQAALTTPQMGSSHYQLGRKLSFLDRMVRKNGPVHCVMIGSSMVDVGFNPEAFQRGYKEFNGENIQCFNFGVDASSAASTQAVARIVTEDYRPQLLIVGTDARDFVLPEEDTDVSVILNTPWIQHRLGNFSIEGWLLDISHFYRYRQHLSRLLRFNNEDTLLKDTRFNYELRPNGSTQLSKVSLYANSPPDLQNESYEVQYYNRIFASYEILDINLQSMEQILAYNGQNVQILIVEMPVPDGYYYFFGNGVADHELFIQAVNDIALRYHVPFWQTGNMDLIPAHGWSDYSHLNITGAEIFSTWLGRQVALAEKMGTLHNIVK